MPHYAALNHLLGRLDVLHSRLDDRLLVEEVELLGGELLGCVRALQRSKHRRLPTRSTIGFTIPRMILSRLDTLPCRPLVAVYSSYLGSAGALCARSLLRCHCTGVSLRAQTTRHLQYEMALAASWLVRFVWRSAWRLSSTPHASRLTTVELSKLSYLALYWSAMVASVVQKGGKRPRLRLQPGYLCPCSARVATSHHPP